MTSTEYRKLAVRTESRQFTFEGEAVARVCHGALGLVTELHELDRSDSTLNNIEELGDVLWYVAIICDALNIGTFECKMADRTDAGQAAAVICDKVKRWHWYRKPITDEDLLGVKNALGMIVGYITWLAAFTGVTMEDVMERNIRKLAIRYPHKFDDYRAENRDIQSEQKALS